MELRELIEFHFHTKWYLPSSHKQYKPHVDHQTCICFLLFSFIHFMSIEI